MLRRVSIGVLFLLSVVCVLYLLRTTWLPFFFSYLTCEDELQKADAIFILSGGGYDRGNEAARIFDAGWAPLIVCTGGNPMPELCVFGIDTLESDMARANLLQWGVPDSVIVMLRNGTSTKEEAQIIFNYCRLHRFKRIIIVSSKLHTYRVNDVFRQKLTEQGVGLVIRGAESWRYNKNDWWTKEEGLIAVNNEWIKTFYYWWKY